MSLKGIELQIALPKTFEAGKIAEQKQQQSQVNQDLASALVEREEKRKNGKVLEAEESAKIRDEDEEKKRKEQMMQSKRKKAESEEEKKKSQTHPYKGSFIDLTT